MKQNLLLSKYLRMLVVFCLLVATTCVQASAQPEQSQQKISIRSAKTLKVLIKQIETSSNYHFAYQSNLVDKVSVGDISGTFKSVEEVLSLALDKTNLTYVVKGNDIVIKKRDATKTPLVALVKTLSGGGSVKVTGQVVDAQTKEPVVGASIWIKDSTVGTSTDVSGNFSFSFSGHYSFVSISFVGYKSIEVPISSKPLHIELEQDNNALDEVVVVGYGVQKKASIIGSISSVSINNMKMPTAKLSTSLAGNLSGVIAVQRSGEPGAGSSFWIRGVSTFGSNASPLVLVDGIERSMDLVDVEDIKEFSILKDAAATAIYGVRGANGVVLITTRSGEEGKPRITLKIESGVISPTKVPDMINSTQFAEMYNDAAGYNFYQPEEIEAYRTGRDPDLYPNVNWLKALYKDHSWNQRVNLNVSGGSSIAKYYIAGAFYNEGGLFATDNLNNYDTSVFYRKYNFRSNVDVKLHKYTTLNVNLATTFERKNNPGTSASSIWQRAYQCSPNSWPMVYSNGQLAGNGQSYNPYVLLTQTGYQEQFWNTAQSLFSLTQDFGDWITKGLQVNIKASFDATNYNSLKRTKTPAQYIATGRDDEGNLITTQKVVGTEDLAYSEGHSGSRTVYLEGTITYARRFERHNVGALFLYQQSQTNKTGVETSELALPYRHQGIAGRVTYDYDSRYFIEGNFGYNGSENFSPGRRFGFFPSVAAGWLISNEKFFQPLTNVVDMLKLKASYGKVGNDQIGGGRRFIYNSTVLSGYSMYFGESAVSYSGLRLGDWANANVGWEESTKLNLGVDVSLFNKLKISVDYFSEDRSGIFLQRKSIPYYVGITTQPWVNIGKMRNRGVDASFEYHQRIGEVDLTARGNFTYARNVITDMDQPDWQYLYMNGTGQARWQQFGYVSLGLFKDQEDIDSSPTQLLGDGVRPGDIKYLDLNGDGVINTYDRKPLGYRNVPEIVYGFGFSARWRSLDFSAFFQGTAHVNFFINSTHTMGFTTANIKEASVFSDVYGNYWSESNQDVNAKYPRLSVGTNANNNQISTFWMANGRYLRLKNLEIGYTLPKKFANRMHMENLRIYASGVNLLTFSPFKLWDPDLNDGVYTYPNNRTISLGLTVGF